MRIIVFLSLFLSISACGPTVDPQISEQSAVIFEEFICEVSFKQTWADGTSLFDLQAPINTIEYRYQSEALNFFDGDELSLDSAQYEQITENHLFLSPSINSFKTFVFASDDEAEMCNSEEQTAVSFTTTVVFTHLERAVNTTSQLCMDKKNPLVTVSQLVSLGPKRENVGVKQTQASDHKMLHGDEEFSGASFSLTCQGI